MTGYATKDYADGIVQQEAAARQAADMFISSIVDSKASIASIPTKTS